MDVLILVELGLSNAGIADRLFVSPKTVDIMSPRSSRSSTRALGAKPQRWHVEWACWTKTA
jgi:orotate phosphoribosyltransferase-like protein